MLRSRLVKLLDKLWRIFIVGEQRRRLVQFRDNSLLVHQSRNLVVKLIGKHWAGNKNKQQTVFDDDPLAEVWGEFSTRVY